MFRSQGIERAGERLASGWHATRGQIEDRFDDMRERAMDHAETGRDQTRRLGRRLRRQAQHLGDEACEVVSGHPVESVVIAAAAGFALGWLARRALERQRRDQRRPRRRPRAAEG